MKIWWLERFPNWMKGIIIKFNNNKILGLYLIGIQNKSLRIDCMFSKQINEYENIYRKFNFINFFGLYNYKM